MVIAVTLPILGAIILGVVQIAKELGLPKQFQPLLALVLGIVGMIGVSFFQENTEIILTGIIIGLSAMGLYSGTKATIGK